MKKTTLYICGLLVAIGTISCSEEAADQNRFGLVIDTKLEYKDGLFYPAGEEQPYSGEVEWRYNNGERAAYIVYEDGYLISRKEYYRDGNLMSELVQEKDTLIYSTRLYRSGQVYTKYERGEVKQWYESGQLQAEWSTDSAGILQGKATAWYQDGSLMGIEHYLDGELEGERIIYDREGIQLEQAMYDDGEKIENES